MKEKLYSLLEKPYTEKIFFWVIFIFCLFFSLQNIQVSLDFPIHDLHSFRQTQTAISTYFLVQGGPWLAYETPVLGAPWSIPFEFPLYQWIVALITSSDANNLERNGRIVSIIFFYLSLIPFALILKNLSVRRSHRLLFLSLVLMSPVYLFWSRTFMIESTVFFLSMSYLASVSYYLRDKKKLYLFLACFFGIFAALVKITTFFGFAICAAILILRDYKRHYSYSLSWISLKQQIAPLIFFALIPLIFCHFWTQFADHLKEKNNFASSYITSKALFEWNFGSWQQRMSSLSWHKFYMHTLKNTLGKGQLIAVVLILLFSISKKYQKRVLLSFAVALMIFLTFTNLHVEHCYYSYASSIFVLASVGWCLIGLICQSKNKKILGMMTFIIILFFQKRDYEIDYLNNYQNRKKEGFIPLAKHIKKVTKKDDVLLIYQNTWSSEIPYFSQRRALMDQKNRELDDPIFKKSLANLKDYKIGAMVICDSLRDKKNFIDKRTKFFKLEEKPSATIKNCSVYPRI